MSEQFAEDQMQEGGEVSIDNMVEPDQSRARSTSPSPVDEARKYRKRAQAAEKSAEQLSVQIAQRDQTIAQQKDAIAALERRQAIDDQLRLSDAIDLESARSLAEASLSAKGVTGGADVSEAIDELKRTKPHLVRTAQRRARVSAPKNGHEDSARAGAIEQAALDASTSGKRSDLLRYLRLRRR